MSDKSAQKKKLILETARTVFSLKGYRGVTMKDIVEACGISRGGLYLYFSSTEEIFLEVLRLERQEADDLFETQDRRLFLRFFSRNRRRSFSTENRD